MLDIRRAELSDAEALRDINARALGYEYGLAETRAQLSRLLESASDCLLVVGRPAYGYIHISDYIATYIPTLSNIMALAVLPEFQGRGAARGLVNAAEDWAKSRGSRGVRLDSGMERKGAHEFYQKVGYAVRKEQKNFIKIFH